MNLFQRLILGGASDQAPPLVGEVLNDLGKTQILQLYTYDQNRPFNYGYVDMRNATSPDVAPLAGAEIYVNGQYSDIFYFNNQIPNDRGFFKQVYLGSNIFTVRVFDDLGQFSPMSNQIEYYVSPYNQLTDTNWVEDSFIGNHSKDVHVRIWKWLDTVYLNSLNTGQGNYLDIFVDFEIIKPVGLTIPPEAIYTATIHGNNRVPTTLTFDSTDNWGGATPNRTLNMGKANPNELDKWKMSGLLGVKLRKIDAPTNVQIKITWRITDTNNQTSTWSHFF